MEGRGGRGEGDWQKSRVKADEGCRGGGGGVARRIAVRMLMIFAPLFLCAFAVFSALLLSTVKGAKGERREGEKEASRRGEEKEEERERGM